MRLGKPKENVDRPFLGIVRLTQGGHESLEQGGKMTSRRQICPLAPTQIDGYLLLYSLPIVRLHVII